MYVIESYMKRCQISAQQNNVNSISASSIYLDCFSCCVIRVNIILNEIKILQIV